MESFLVKVDKLSFYVSFDLSIPVDVIKSADSLYESSEQYDVHCLRITELCSYLSSFE